MHFDVACMHVTSCAKLLKLCLAAAAGAVQALGDEPVWRQVLHMHRYHNHPAVKQQEAAGLAE
jgi:hypothetical protein